METVSPLYSNGALGISAVGYSLNSDFDHVPVSLLSSHNAPDKCTSYAPLSRNPRDSTSHISSTTNTPSSVSACFAPPSEYSHSSASRHGDMPMQVPRSRKRKEQASSTDFDTAVDPEDTAHMRDYHPPRPASRLKRLSSLTLSTFSSVSSPSRLSRTFSFSTKSSSPFFGASQQTTPQPPPNKLVKRSLSQLHSRSGPTTPASFRDRIPTRRSVSYNLSGREHEQSPDAEPLFDKPRSTRTFSLSNLISSAPSLRKSSAPRSLSARLIRRKYAAESNAEPRLGPSEERISNRYGVISPLHCHPIQAEGWSEAAPDRSEHSHARFAAESSFAQWGQSPNEHLHSSPVGQSSTHDAADNSFHGMTNDFARLSYRSWAASHAASTIPESEQGTRVFSSGDEDEADCRSDTVFDSLRTGITSLSSVGAAVQLKALFEPTEDAYVHSDNTLILTVAAHPDGTERSAEHEHVHMRHNDQSDSNRESHASQAIGTDGEHSSVLQFASRKLSDSSGSSASQPRRSTNRDEVPYDADSENDLSSSDEDDEMIDSSETRANDAITSAASSPPTGEEQSADLDHPPSSNTPHKSTRPHVEFDVRNSLFDWSEQPSVEKGSITSTPPRPKTVHGKKDAESRGSRSTGRRVPSGIHARSQSVPVVSDATGKRTSVTSKFGTWGVGSKVASEDWDDDFDFGVDDLKESLPTIGEDKRTDNGIAMLVPKAIREQQTNVIANIGLLKEWGLLIEELKELRVKVHSLGLISKPDVDLFEQVDAMIDLADQEADDEPLEGFRSIESSPGFNLRDFEQSPASQLSHRTPRKALGTDDDPFTASNAMSSPTGTPPSKPQDLTVSAITNRPRKDSEAVAKSVIEALQRRGKTPAASSATDSAAKKVPFDTATLRHIVPYVNGLTHRMKQLLREAEGLQPPVTTRTESPFSHVFAEPVEDSPTLQRHRRITERLDEEDEQMAA